MTKEEQQEFRDLKRTKCVRGFLLDEEEKRFNVLFDLNAIRFRKKMEALELEYKQMEQN